MFYLVLSNLQLAAVRVVNHLGILVPDPVASRYYLSHPGIHRTNYQQLLELGVLHYQQPSL